LDKEPKCETEGSKRWIEDRLGGEVLSYCYPFYYFTDDIRREVINAGYKQARLGHNNKYMSRGFSDWFAVDCRQIQRQGEVVTEWAKPGCWHVLTFHGIGTDQDGWEPVTEAEFARQMAALATLRDLGAAEVVTFKEGADRLRQMA
jgi:hypothetical protein